VGLIPAVLATAPAARATPPLYLVDTPFDAPVSSTVYTIDPANGAMAPRSEIGSEYAPILAIAAADGRVLYAAGTDNAGTVCPPAEGFSCLLLRIELAQDPSDPPVVAVIGPFRSPDRISELVGLTFRSDGTLFGISSARTFLHRRSRDRPSDPRRDRERRFLRGDLTFDALGRLWVWTNAAPSKGSEMDPNGSLLLSTPAG
jgi:hypothetical protein